MNVLDIVREYTLKKMKIVHDKSHFVFDSVCIEKSTKTNYKVWGTGKDSIRSNYYDLESIVFLLDNSDLTHPSYVLAATQNNVGVIRRPDRKDLLSYITGESETSENIDLDPQPLDNMKQQSIINNDVENIDLDEIDIKKNEEIPAPVVTTETKEINLEDSIKDTTLSQTMSLDQIAAIKAKRLAKKRTMINQPEKNLTMEKSISLIEKNLDCIKRIKSNERCYTNRFSILRSKNKKFTTNIFNILRFVKTRDNKLAGSNSTVRNAEKENQGYSRYEQKKIEETEGFKIKTKLTYSGMTLKSVTESMSSGFKGMDFSAQNNNGASRPKKKISRTPIIIIPGSTTSLITLANCYSLLSDLKFTSTDDSKNILDTEVIINRKSSSNVSVPYKIIDNIRKLAPEDWSRVVAVFVQGPSWQFKGWPWNGNPVEIFANMKAFHIKWKQFPTDKNIQKWAVQVLELDQMYRHLDRALLQQIWKSIDSFLIKNKPHLRF